MTANEGTLDRTFRVILGLAIAVLGLMTQSWWGLVAIIPLATAAIGWCPLYTLVGLNTCSTST